MNITHKHIDDIFEYDGSQINPSWAFQNFGIYGSSIITWLGPVNITLDNLKDYADVGLEIKSDMMVNFICEFFDQQPTNMRVAYLRQRLLVMIFCETLCDYGVKCVRKGDDVFVKINVLTCGWERKITKELSNDDLFDLKEKLYLLTHESADL